MSISASIPGNVANGLAADSQSLDALRMQARQDPDKALKQAAKQFETVFMNMMLKAMRDATPQDGEFDSEQTKMFTSMLDQQLAQNMGSRGVGLADIMVRQLSRQLPAVVAPVPLAKVASSVVVQPVAARDEQLNAASKLAEQQKNAAPAAHKPLKSSLPSAYNENFQQDFVQRMLPHAEKASRTTGVPAHLMLGQAALESGWGRRNIRMTDGKDSHNLFGIKAGANWKGKVAEVKTTEYHHGIASKPTEKFRAYDSYADAFVDYAKLLRGDGRYADVLTQGDDAYGFAQALQNSGYATDPQYAEKLVKVISRARSLG